jgi:hypothetical protein
MKSLRPFLVTAVALGIASVLSAADTPQPAPSQPVAAATDPAASPSVASGNESYPLTTCVVSGEPLEGGGMGDPVDYIHKEPGKPDRLVRFCCKGCIAEFRKNPAKYLAKIDDASSAKPR